MASAWSAALRAVPGFLTGSKTSSTAPTFTAPSIPTMPAIDDARAPNALNRSWLSTQIANLPGKYNPMLEAARNDAKYRLAGYGGVSFGQDDPSTPQREDLQVSFDPNAKMGEREKQAVRAEDNSANARGLLFSSFRNQAVGAALVRMSEEKRDIVNQFSAGINSVLAQQANETTSYIGDWVKMFGEDSRWLADNPPPPPPVAPGHSFEDAQAYDQAARDRVAASQDPTNPANKAPGPVMTYTDFLKGRKSTKALAQAWDQKYNGGRRFG